VVCQECESSLHIKLVKSKVRKYRVLDRKSKGLTKEMLVAVLEAGAAARKDRVLDTGISKPQDIEEGDNVIQGQGETEGISEENSP